MVHDRDASDHQRVKDGAARRRVTVWHQAVDGSDILAVEPLVRALAAQAVEEGTRTRVGHARIDKMPAVVFARRGEHEEPIPLGTVDAHLPCAQLRRRARALLAAGPDSHAPSKLPETPSAARWARRRLLRHAGLLRRRHLGTRLHARSRRQASVAALAAVAAPAAATAASAAESQRAGVGERAARREEAAAERAVAHHVRRTALGGHSAAAGRARACLE